MQTTDRHAVRAIALDANVFGNATFTIKQIQALEREATEADVEVWLPDIVAWELASNIADQLEAARESAKGADGALRRAGLRGIDLPYENRASLIEATLEVIQGESVKIIDLTPSEAYEALKDQVQLAGTGRREKGVKTGAADSAWVRSVLREAKTTPDQEVVIVSGDGDVDRMIANFGVRNVSLAINWNEVRGHLFEYRASTETAQALVRFLVAAIDDGSIDEILDLTPLQDAGISNEIEGGPWHYFEPFDIDIDLHSVSALAALTDVEANARGGVRATAVFLADVTVAGWFNDNDGNPVSDEETLFGVPVLAQVAARLDAASIVEAHLEDTAQVRSTATRWEDDTEALGECMHQLHFVPALAETRADFSLIGQYGEDTEVSVTLGDAEFEIRVSTEPGTGWETEASIGDQQMIVRCEYDATTWVGGDREGMHMEPPYELSVADQMSFNGSPLYALSAFAMKASANVAATGLGTS